MSRKKLFVGNLSWTTDEDSLKNHFSKIGAVVSVRIIADQYTGKSKGFGFVEMDSPELAQTAIKDLNDQPFMDRNLRVSLALERAERGGNERGSSERGDRGGDRDSRGGGGGGRDSRGGGDRPYRSRQVERTY
jgi:RNA recognition motif-containing protein